MRHLRLFEHACCNILLLCLHFASFGFFVCSYCSAVMAAVFGLWCVYLFWAAVCIFLQLLLVVACWLLLAVILLLVFVWTCFTVLARHWAGLQVWIWTETWLFFLGSKVWTNIGLFYDEILF